jgi:hypothetical protein
MSTVEVVDVRELPQLGPCRDCGAQWSGKTLLRSPDPYENGGYVMCCDTCGFDSGKHRPVIWPDEEAAQ